jgi:spore maturation protein CgeB/glycosyltransferase involved in cell wall biosynthesis
MSESIVKKAHEAFKKGDFESALAAYRDIGSVLGRKYFKANVEICEKRLGYLKPTQSKQNVPLSDLKVACVMDDFTFHSFDPECKLFQLTPQNVTKELEQFQPDLLFIESAWRGKDELWDRKIGQLSAELKAALKWCKDHGVPRVFWNKEDPIHFETFLNTAQQFDYVFTTDIDCIARYKAALGHDRVYLLPFACQPKLHNPIEVYQRKDAFCFAGAYYVRYPERIRDLEGYVRELPNFRPLEIYDRNFGKNDPNYQFPPEYQPYIVGTLPFSEIDKAYKGYKYSINLNSIKQSQTMFARRVYELLASNTLTVSNFSRGLRLMFGDLVISTDDGKEALRRLESLGEDKIAKLRLAGLRKVLLEHTYQNRLAYIAKKALSKPIDDSLPEILVFAKTETKDEVIRIFDQFNRQAYRSKRLILVSSRSQELKSLVPDLKKITILGSEEANKIQLSQLTAIQKTWLGCFSLKDYYGANFLVDLALATLYTDVSWIGKEAHLTWAVGEGAHLVNADSQYKFTNRLVSNASICNGDALDSGLSVSDFIDKYSSLTRSLRGFAVDEYSYCRFGLSAGDVAAISRLVDNDESIDCGMSFRKIRADSENIQAAEYDESKLPRWAPDKLYELFGHGSKHLKITQDLSGLRVQSELPDGKHEYIYAKSATPVAELSRDSPLQSYLDTSPGLNLRYLFKFLDKDKKTIDHVIHTGNSNQSVLCPIGTSYINLGLRAYGPGGASIRSMLFANRELAAGTPPVRSDTLLLTNHYPSYDDLYRNGFVHSRVRAYRDRDVRVDVFRFRPGQSPSFHEYQDIDVMTGSQELLKSLLGTGKYKNVLVHFLEPMMWEVLKHHIGEVRVFVWVHGAEIQPLHRREYNYTNEAELKVARDRSDARTTFWRGILTKPPPNLHLVFVSQYFANEVMEDLCIDLPESSFSVIHNPIETSLFTYRVKPIEQRKKILSIRSFASRKYANDLSVQTILDLSKKPFFEDLEFRIIGDGVLFDSLLAPLKNFKNVTIEKGFVPQNEIAELHKYYGLFLCPSRMDAQGVSRDEAMSSGLVPLTNLVAAIPEFVDESDCVLAPAESYEQFVSGIENIYYKPKLFSELSKAAAKRVRAQTDSRIIIDRELRLFQAKPQLNPFG